MSFPLYALYISTSQSTVKSTKRSTLRTPRQITYNLAPTYAEALALGLSFLYDDNMAIVVEGH